MKAAEKPKYISSLDTYSRKLWTTEKNMTNL